MSVRMGVVYVCVGVCVGGVEVGGGTVVEAAVAAVAEEEEREEKGEEVVEVEGVFSSAISVTNMSCPPYSLKELNLFNFSFLTLLGVSSYSSTSTSTPTLWPIAFLFSSQLFTSPSLSHLNLSPSPPLLLLVLLLLLLLISWPWPTFSRAVADPYTLKVADLDGYFFPETSEVRNREIIWISKDIASCLLTGSTVAVGRFIPVDPAFPVSGDRASVCVLCVCVTSVCVLCVLGAVLLGGQGGKSEGEGG